MATISLKKLLLPLYLSFLSIFTAVTFSTNNTNNNIVISSRLIHRFSDELRGFTGGKLLPEYKSKEYYKRLLMSDLERYKMKIGRQRQLVFPYQGCQTTSFGNDLGWLHYTWIDIGTPQVSFLVALDVGSDLLWVPCDCVQCAPLSATHYSSLDKNLNEYSPSVSDTSQLLNCSHQLCTLQEKCKSPNQPCPYLVNYNSADTSSSGQLVEDVLHLSLSSHTSPNLKASVVFGCGKKQSGVYLDDGVAPDGLMGLGLADVSVPSLLAKSGLIRNSFSLCFNENGSGRIYFGDQGLTTHHWTPFLPLNGKYSTYVVGVDAICLGKNSCLKQTSFHAVVDSGTSFTFVPKDVYKIVTQEFSREVKAARMNTDGYPWEYCYESSGEQPLDFPAVEFRLSSNQSFMVLYPLFPVTGVQGTVMGYCLAIESTDQDIALIGQNFMIGYSMVFDRDNMKLGWSHSDCQDISNPKRTPLGGGKPPDALPTNEQQSIPGAQAVSPAIAGRAPSRANASSSMYVPFTFWMLLTITFITFVSSHLLWNFESVTAFYPM